MVRSFRRPAARLARISPSRVRTRTGKPKRDTSSASFTTSENGPNPLTSPNRSIGTKVSNYTLKVWRATAGLAAHLGTLFWRHSIVRIISCLRAKRDAAAFCALRRRSVGERRRFSISRVMSVPNSSAHLTADLPSA